MPSYTEYDTEKGYSIRVWNHPVGVMIVTGYDDKGKAGETIRIYADDMDAIVLAIKDFQELTDGSHIR